MIKDFSVLTVSKRVGWEKVASQSIRKQTVQPKEWILITEQDKHLTWMSSPKPAVYKAPLQTRASNLNASLNAGLKKVTTRFVIFYQDFIELEPDCFEKLLALGDNTTFVTTCTPNYDGSDDTRYTGVHGPRICHPVEWEANVALAPMRAIKELGGFEEELDNGWSWDNVNLAERADMLGYSFVLDETNRPKLLKHELTTKLQLELNNERHERIMQEVYEGDRPLKAPYL